MRPQQLRLLGAGSNGTQGAVSNVYGGLTSTGGSVDLSATLQSYCVQGSDCSAAIQTATSAYQSLGASAQSAVVDLANGNGVAAASAIAPLIGGALGATVGGPLGAAIGATVAGSVESIFSGLFGQQSPPQPVSCTYVLWSGNNGVGLCFQNPAFAPGPTDPTTGNPDSRWITFEDVMTKTSTAVGHQTATWQTVHPDLTAWPGFGNNFLDDVFGGFSYLANGPYSATLRGSLAANGINLPSASGVPTPPPALGSLIDGTAFNQTVAGNREQNWSRQDIEKTIGQFVAVYCQAFLRGVVELLINNRQVSAELPITLLEATVQAWNASHEPTATYIFDPNNSVSSFVDAVIQNMVPLPLTSPTPSPSANGGYAQKINVGPAIPFVRSGTFQLHPGWSASKKTTAATVGKIALYVGVPIVLAAGGYSLWAYFTGQAQSEAWKRLGHTIWDQSAKSGEHLVAANPLKGAKLLGAGEAAEEAPKKSLKVQSLLFPKSEFTVAQSRAWARAHQFKAAKVEGHGEYHRIRQFSPARSTVLRTIPFGDSGIKAVVAR